MPEQTLSRPRHWGAALAMTVFVCLCLCVTSFALAASRVEVENNTLHTGTVKINLNDGKPVITEEEYLFEPGMTVDKPFFVRNESSDAVYYRIYMENVSGGLQDVLELEIRNGDTCLFTGTARELTQKGAFAVGSLALGQKQELTLRFHFPEHRGNETMDQRLLFDLRADAVQMRNNPEADFGD